MAIDAGVLTQLQEHYSQDITKILFEDGRDTSPLLALCEAKARKEGMGRGYVERIVTHEGAAAGADASVIDTIAGDGAAGGRPSRDRWVVQPVNMDSTFVFSRDEIMAIEGMRADEQFDVISDEMDLAVSRIRNKLALQVSGKGWGCLAVTTAQTSSTFTVSTDVINRFFVGQRLTCSASEDTDVLLGTPAGAQLRVTGIAESTGVVTLSGDPTSTWTSSATLYIFAAGDRITTDPSSALSACTTICGLQTWIDSDATLALWGVTRSGNSALRGHGLSASGMDSGQALIAGADALFRFGKKADTALVPGVTWKLLQQDYDSAKTVDVQLGEYKVGFKAIKVPTIFGEMTVIPDPFLPAGTAYLGPFQDKRYAPYLAHSGAKLVNLDNFDGKEFERVTTSGARTFKGQFFFRGNLVVPGPGCYLELTSMPTS